MCQHSDISLEMEKLINSSLVRLESTVSVISHEVTKGFFGDLASGRKRKSIKHSIHDVAKLRRIVEMICNCGDECGRRRSWLDSINQLNSDFRTADSIIRSKIQ